MLNQATRQYPVQNKNSTCNLSLHKNEILKYSSFEKFLNFNFGMNKPTSKLNYEFDFFSVLPVEIEGASKIVQRFKVSILIDQDFVEERDSGLPMGFFGAISGNNIILDIEYSDYNVGRNLQITVRDWVNSLEKRSVPKWLSLTEKKSDLISTMGPFLFLATSLIGIAAWFEPSSNIELFTSIMSSLGLSVIIYSFGKILITEMYRQLLQSKPLTFICITDGDKARHKNITEKRKSKSIIALSMITTIIIAVPVNLFSNWLFELKLFW